ncbi:MAG: mechanosensitive ion channel [Bryobacterales bacterium]|nr:mechanosensitive ion channel [Bryobacterales bacterium]
MREKLLQAFVNLADSVIAAAPKVLIGLLLAAAALVVARVIESVLRFALTKVRFDSLLAKVGVDRTLQRLGVRQQLNLVLPRLVYFLVLLLLAKTAVDALGLTAISDAIGAFFAYLPNIVAALLLLVLGSTVGQFAGQTVAQSAESSGIEFAPALGRLVSSLILFVCAMMAIDQLKIDTEIVRIVTSFVLGAGALAFGLSFGLGTRDVVRNVAAGFYARKVLVVGKRLDVAGQQGVLKAITATHLILESEGRETSVSNETFLQQVARQ